MATSKFSHRQINVFFLCVPPLIPFRSKDFYQIVFVCDKTLFIRSGTYDKQDNDSKQSKQDMKYAMGGMTICYSIT